jgi:hypothetical protein
MNDTPQYILQKQFDIMHAKPLKERIKGLFEMTELSRSIIINQLHKKNPELNEIELKIELFKAFYRFDFDLETLNKIAGKMKEFLLKENTNKQKIT